ncbi:MAG TPA: hypothetical protein VIS49_06890 [Cyclobacteriaceae bacterium]
MKKLLSLIAFVIVCSIFSSCTEENITPKTTDNVSTQGTGF